MQDKTDRQDNENMTAKKRSGEKRTGDNDAGAGHLGQESLHRTAGEGCDIDITPTHVSSPENFDPNDLTPEGYDQR